METSEIAKYFAEFTRKVTAFNKLLVDISKLDTDRTRNIVGLQARIAKLDACVEALRQIPDVAKQLDEWLVSYRNELLAFREEQVKQFGVRLENELRKQGLELTGHYPELHAGVFTIEINRDKWKITLWYGPKQERLGTCAVTAEETSELVQKYRTSLGSQVEETVFIQRLQESLSRLQKTNDGEAVPIIAVLGQLALVMQNKQFQLDPRRENYHSYGRADFSIDLVRFGRLIRFRTAIVQLARNRSDYLWIPNDEHSLEGAVYSHLSLRKEVL